MSNFLKLLAVMALGMVVGCGPKGPTYNEALQIYENEQKELTRLESECLFWHEKEGTLGELNRMKKEHEYASKLRRSKSRGMDAERRNLDQDLKEAEEELAAAVKIENGDNGSTPKQDALRKEIEAQKNRVAAAKSVIDELRKSK